MGVDFSKLTNSDRYRNKVNGMKLNCIVAAHKTAELFSLIFIPGNTLFVLHP